jgi:hypothetical protein
LVWVFRPAIEFGVWGWVLRSSDNTTITTQYFGKVYEKIKQNTSSVGMGAINTINSVITVITDIRFVGDIAIDVVLVTNGITIINIINLTGGTELKIFAYP